ncbi:cell surface protein [Bifidobacterium pseudolongum subsp. globosum]|uniref:Cell surface protein n=1 Tax=Bifidobacterium pseudolongum subsp. globosum TaxID=1690 RepID=A0A4Q5AN05_9BIFI|nr:DUF6466 family protein [Bifidobacterium pseudolongum]RYQ22543.1 cell surface protein [Bifidobacterium pseudolongum subsp. globosum]RYQ30880.1 cell surface protein [Bifidobacterium pseudolongum subsp. globosum]
MTSQPQPRRTRAVRIVLGVCTVALLACAGLAGWNLRAAGLYNQATATLTATLRDAAAADSDIKQLLAQQQQTDAQLAEAQQASMLLLPSVRAAIAHNSQVSGALTERLQQQVDATTQSAPQATTGDSTTNSQGGEPALTDEQREQIEQMLRNNEQTQESQDQAVQHDGERHSGTDTSGGDAKPW